MLGEHKSTSYTLFKWSVLFFFSAFPPFRLKFFFIYFCRNHFIISRTRYLYNTCIFFRSYCEHFLWNLPVSQALFLSIHFILSTILYACPQCIIIIIIQNSTFYGFWPRTMTMMFFLTSALLRYLPHDYFLISFILNRILRTMKHPSIQILHWIKWSWSVVLPSFFCCLILAFISNSFQKFMCF